MQPTLSPVAANTPFRLQAAPGEAVAHPAWQRARAATLAVVGRDEAVLLVGPPGTGKTLLLQDLAQALRRDGRSVRLVNRGDALEPHLRTGGVLLVDEAGFMDADALARLCASDKPFVLAALPDFAERLAGVHRPITTVTLEPLSPVEVARFVAARLAAAGQPRDMLEPDAVLALARNSGGLLRLVNVLGSAAVFLAELEDAPRVARRHVDGAVSMRDGVDENAALPLPAAPEPTAAAAPSTDEALAPHVPPPARRRYAARVAAAIALGLVLVGGWIGSERWVAQPRSRDRMAATSHDDASRPAPSQGQPPPRQATATSTPSRASTALPQQPMMPSVPVSFRGPVYNETMQQGGQMSLVITRREPAGAITARFEAWGGLLGSGELSGHLSDTGRIVASGQLMMGRNPFICDLSGFVAGGKLIGSASFVRSGSGRVAYSRFTLTRS